MKFLKKLFFRQQTQDMIRRYVEVEYRTHDQQSAYERMLREAGL